MAETLRNLWDAVWIPGRLATMAEVRQAGDAMTEEHNFYSEQLSKEKEHDRANSEFRLRSTAALTKQLNLDLDSAFNWWDLRPSGQEFVHEMDKLNDDTYEYMEKAGIWARMEEEGKDLTLVLPASVVARRKAWAAKRAAEGSS